MLAADLQAYIAIVGKLAEEFDAVLVGLQSFIDEKIKKVPPKMWSDDFMYPNIWTHRRIAQRWLEVIGL